MDDVLLEIVLRRLGESPLAEPPTDLLLAALQSEESLSAQLAARPRSGPLLTVRTRLSHGLRAPTCGRSQSAASEASASPRP